MILLDTDHLTVLRYSEHLKHAGLRARMADSLDQHFGTTIVTIEEQLRGWLAVIHKQRDIRQQMPLYDRLAQMVTFLHRWQIVCLGERASAVFDELRRQRVRIGTQDLKIASIALAQDALLLSANLRDFRQVPGLHVENCWSDVGLDDRFEYWKQEPDIVTRSAIRRSSGVVVSTMFSGSKLR